MKNDDFFENIRPWSRRKHRLLDKYLRPFSAKVASRTQNREIFCVDGFAGAAKYDDGSQGSPLLIARFSDECARWSNPVQLRIINVEPDSKNQGIFASLEDATTEWVKNGTVTNIKSDFRSALPEILRTIGDSPALFFIDPFGPTYLHFQDLELLFRRSQRITEVIINFDQDGLRRIVDAALSDNTNPKVALTNSQNITKIVGSEDWKGKIENELLTTLEKETILLREYMLNISKFGYEVVGYPICEVLGAKPKYHFVYSTRHRDGVTLMNDFIREEEDLLYGDHVDDSLPLFSDEASLSRAIEDRKISLQSKIEAYLIKNRVVTRNQIRNDLIPFNFGSYHSKDYNDVVRRLLLAGVLKESSGKIRINDTDVLRFTPEV